MSFKFWFYFRRKSQIDVESMSGDDYDKANIVVNELQDQVEENGIEFLKAEFLLKQKVKRHWCGNKT